MAFGGPRSFCVRPGAHSARHQDSRNDWDTVSHGRAFRLPPALTRRTPTKGSALRLRGGRRLRSLAFLRSSAEPLFPGFSASF